ncbi:zinc ribbon domain-containing protein [Singulisphaera sp. Ch08]|uniref:Zinc ribbon domain-containing protein n=1 Tax=Singulisphaera sp. Ch08 TaxID=3120278 RepID=A0AAU7CM77_9BACT
MFCPECGTKGGGKFCVQCGTKLSPPGTTTAAMDHVPEPEPRPEPEPAADWSREVRHDLLITHPEVRALLKDAAKRSGTRISGEQLIKFHDKYLAKFNYGIAVGDVASIAAPLFTRLGVKTGKARSEVILAPIGHATVAALCSLTAHGITMKDVEQASDGCVIEATIPPDLLVYEGTLVVTLADLGDRSRVDALTKIGGQYFDWGKSTRLLDRLFTDIRAFRP